jgi:hypothetical protein
MGMKRITIPLNDELYRRACIRAAEANTSLPAMVEAFLRQVTSVESDIDRCKQLQRETIASIHAFSAGDRLSRDQIHEVGT